ncbi:unnamed protein product [Urochloa humidicola]
MAPAAAPVSAAAPLPRPALLASSCYAPPAGSRDPCHGKLRSALVPFGLASCGFGSVITHACQGQDSKRGEASPDLTRRVHVAAPRR